MITLMKPVLSKLFLLYLSNYHYIYETMKKLIFTFVLLLYFMPGNAQTDQSDTNQSIRYIEGEVGAGISFATDKLLFDRNLPGATFYAEARYNLRYVPLDVGVQEGGTIFHREAFNERLKFRSVNVLAVTDCYLRRYSKISFFVGLGAGYASLNRSQPIMINLSDSLPSWSRRFSTGPETEVFCFMSRIGVELFHHFRVTLNYKRPRQDQAHRHLGLSLGVVFGGGLK